MSGSNNNWIGKNTVRPDGADKVTGRAAFAADSSMPGMIWGKVLRSPHAHAVIKGIDTSKAEALPGVKAVMTAADIVDFPLDTPVPLGIQDMRWMCRNVMAREKALFHGHPVAAVAAMTEAIAAEACKLIEVDYEVLPHAIEIDDALAPDAPILHDFIEFEGKPSNIAATIEHTKGDVEAGFAEADMGQFRISVCDPGHGLIFSLCRQAEENIAQHNAGLISGHMGKAVGSGDIANGEDAPVGCAQALIQY